jgi:signal transduction histidine kinase
MGEYIFWGSAILSIANGGVLLWLNPRRNVNRAFFVTSVCIAAWATATGLAIFVGHTSTAEPNQEPLLWIRVSLVFGALVGWSAWLTRTAILSEAENFTAVLAESWQLMIVAAFAAAVGASELYVPSTSTQLERQRGIGLAIYTALAVFSCLWMLYDGIRQQRALTGVKKIEMQFFVLGLVCACILLLASIFVVNNTTLQHVRHLTPLWFVCLHLVAVWTVCSHKVFEAKHLVTALGYRIAMLCSVGCFALATKSYFVRALGETPALFVTAVAGGAIALAADPTIKRCLKIDRERLLEAPRRAAINAAASISDEEMLKKEFANILEDICQTDDVRWLIVVGSTQEISGLSPPEKEKLLSAASAEGWTTPEALQRKPSHVRECLSTLRLLGLGAIVAAPRNSSAPSLVVLLGEKASRRPYTFPDIELLLDVTELMDNLLTHSRAASIAARVEKLAAAAMISRGLAHDLNNLATPVASFLTHMEGRVPPHSSEAKVLADARNALWVMQNYIRDSLFFSRNLTPRLEVIAAKRLLDSVLRLSNERAREASVHISSIADENLQFVADFAMMQRLLQNLVFNGIDASQPKHLLVMSAQINRDNQLVILISDQGTGVPAELREKIFEPYYTTKDTGNKRRGLGLGLAICRKIAELHRAEISVLQNVPSGSVFMVSFPPEATDTRHAVPFHASNNFNSAAYEHVEIATDSQS